MFRKLVVGAAILAIASAYGGESSAADAEDFSLSLSGGYRYRAAAMSEGDDRTDQDTVVGIGVSAKNLPVEGLTLNGFGEYVKDLDGTSESSPFKDGSDTYSNRDQVRVYRAYAQYENPALPVSVKAGRMPVWSAENVTIDGGLVGLGSGIPWGDLELFAGRRVSFSSDPDETAVYGGNLKVRPLEGLVLKVEDVYYIENTLEVSALKVCDNHSFSLTYRHFADDPESLSAVVTLEPWSGGEAVFGYKRRFAEDDIGDSPEFDYTDFDDEEVDALILGGLAPYSDYFVELNQLVMDYVWLGGKARKHNLVDEADEDVYNTDFVEVSADAELSGWPLEGFTLYASATRWYEQRERGDLDEDNSWGFDGGISQKYMGHSVGLDLYRSLYDEEGADRSTRGFHFWLKGDLEDFGVLSAGFEREFDDLYREEGIESISEFSARWTIDF